MRTPARWHTGADHHPFGEYSLDHPQHQKHDDNDYHDDHDPDYPLRIQLSSFPT
jgi:hypothetical protein